MAVSDPSGGAVNLANLADSSSSSSGGRSRRGRSTAPRGIAPSTLLRISAGHVLDPMKMNLTQSKIQSGQFLTSENLRRATEQIQQQGQQIAQQIKIQRGLSAASGAGTSPVAQQRIQALYTKLVDLNRKQQALEQKAYIQNALANQQLDYARNQYLQQMILLNASGNAPPQPGQAFG